MPNLKSEKIFSRLHPSLASLLKDFNYNTFTNIQHEVLPSALSSNSLFVQAPTGTGKTLCYLIPILDRLFKTNKSYCGLILLPTKELSTQVYTSIKRFVPEQHYKISIINGVSSLTDEIKELKKKPRVIIGTPGRIAQHVTTSHLDLPSMKLKYLVFDESDLLFQSNFKSEINTILEKCVYLHKKENKTCFICLSATCSEGMMKVVSEYNLKIKTAFSDNDDITDINKNNQNDNIYKDNKDKLEIMSSNNKLTNIKERMLFTPKHKLNALVLYILQNPSSKIHKQGMNLKTIIFFNSIEKAKIFFKFLETIKKDYGLNIPYLTILTGDMDSTERQIYLKKFKGVLISTDIASRGLDVENVDLVINYDVPKTEKTYTHRIGRTGRAGKRGTAITFVNEHNIKQFVKMEMKLERKIKETENKEFGKLIEVKKENKVYKKLKIEESVLNGVYLSSRAILRENKKI